MTREDPKPGRPRDPETDQAILRATLKLLTDRGYAGMSVEGVASKAGVAKSTIYRRYSSKEELVAAALGALRDDLGPLPDTGDIRTDIVEMILQTRRAIKRGPGFGMVGALLVEEHRSPELLELLRERVLRPRRDEAIMVLQRGLDRGEIRADADLEVAVQAMVGAVFTRHIFGASESRERVEQTVDTVWNGLAATPESGRPATSGPAMESGRGDDG